MLEFRLQVRRCGSHLLGPQVLPLSSPPVPWLSPSISSQTVWHCFSRQIQPPSLHWLLLGGDIQQCLCILSNPKLLLCHIHHSISSRPTSLANLWETLSKCRSLHPHARVLDSAHITLLNGLSEDGRLQESPENLDSSAAQTPLSILSSSTICTFASHGLFSWLSSYNSGHTPSVSPLHPRSTLLVTHFLEYRGSFCHYYTHPFSLRSPITQPFHYLRKLMTYWSPH